MGDGKALQMGTSHELGQNFAKAFNTRYLSKDGKQELVWQTSWGSTTRMVGAPDHDRTATTTVCASRLVSPPIQVVVLAIKGDEAVLAKVREIGDRLKAAGVRVRVDDRTDTPFGRRAVDWELKGVPVRDRGRPARPGERHRDAGPPHPGRQGAGARSTRWPSCCPRSLEEDQALLLTQSRERREARTVEVTTIEEAAEAAATGGWARIPWADAGPGGRGQARRAGRVRAVPGRRGRFGARRRRRRRATSPSWPAPTDLGITAMGGQNRNRSRHRPGRSSSSRASGALGSRSGRSP